MVDAGKTPVSPPNEVQPASTTHYRYSVYNYSDDTGRGSDSLREALTIRDELQAKRGGFHIVHADDIDWNGRTMREWEDLDDVECTECDDTGEVTINDPSQDCGRNTKPCKCRAIGNDPADE